MKKNFSVLAILISLILFSSCEKEYRYKNIQCDYGGYYPNTNKWVITDPYMGTMYSYQGADYNTIYIDCYGQPLYYSPDRPNYWAIVRRINNRGYAVVYVANDYYGWYLALTHE